MTARETQYLYDRWKVNSISAPYAANPFALKPKGTQMNRKVCFIGTPHGSRAEMINTLSKGGVNIDLFYNKKEGELEVKNKSRECDGDSFCSFVKQTKFDLVRYKEGRKLVLGKCLYQLWHKSFIEDNSFIHFLPSCSFDEMSLHYSEYALSLASTSYGHTDALPKPLKVINLRNFEIPMSGGLEFCRFNPELAEYFEDGKEIVFYHSNDDMIDKALYYTKRATDSEITQMRKSARERAEAQHAWINRFSLVFDKLGLRY